MAVSREEDVVSPREMDVEKKVSREEKRGR